MEGRHWLIVTAAVAVILVAVVGLRSFSSSPKVDTHSQPGQAVTVQPTPGAIVISMASSNTKQDWLHQATAAFNAAAKSNKDYQVEGRPVFVEILQEDIDGKKVDYRSGTMVSDTVKQKIKPTVLSPGEESWIEKFKKEWQVMHGANPVRGDSPVVVRTPLVVAMWQSRAEALGCWPNAGPSCTWEKLRALATNPDGWKLYKHPEWGKFTFGYGYFGQSNSGTLGVISMCMAGTKKTKGLTASDVAVNSNCGKFIAGIEAAKVHSGKSDVWLLGKMIKGGPEYLDAVVTYESNVILHNRKHAQEMRESLVSYYPQDGTVVVGHPYAILDNVPWVTPEQVAAAKIFGKYLLSSGEQEAVLALGLRPADTGIKVGPPIDQASGANPNVKLVVVDLPDTLLIDRIGEVWHSAKKKAVVVIVFDKSGSMAGEGKIGAAAKGAQEFVRAMELGDILIWMPFDGTVYTGGARGAKAEVGETLVKQIASTPASGDTALYDAIMEGMNVLESYRKKLGDTYRYGMALLSDGQDTRSANRLTDVEARLKPQESDPGGFQIHAACIGSDCDERVLKTIAAAAHGKFWKGKSAQDMVKVYQEIATHY